MEGNRIDGNDIDKHINENKLIRTTSFRAIYYFIIVNKACLTLLINHFVASQGKCRRYLLKNSHYK